MSETKRDPRVDPKPGDILRKGNRQRHVIKSAISGPGWMAYQTPTDMRRENGGMTLEVREYWSKWAKNAEVIHAGE